MKKLTLKAFSDKILKHGELSGSRPVYPLTNRSEKSKSENIIDMHWDWKTN